MTIIASELKTYKSSVVDDTVSNGGVMSPTEVVDNAVQNIFPHVFKAERDAGSEKYRKIFDKVDNSSSEVLYAGLYFLDGPTLGDDWAIFFAGTQRDIQSTLSETDIHGSGLMKYDVTSGTTEVTVDVKDLTLVGMIQAGMTIRISDKDTIDSSGNEEFHTVAGTGISLVGTVVTFDTVDVLTNSYAVADGTKISTVYEFGDVETSQDNWDDSNTTSGTYDEAGSPLTLNNLGTVEDTWTLTFTSATEFDVIGAYHGAIGSGIIGTNFEPSNSSFSQPYFTLLSAGWGGTWAINDNIVFQTHPAAVPLWLKRVVPVACTPISNNKLVKVTSGETA